MKNINYLKLYLTQYKNIPNFVFWGTIIVFTLASMAIGFAVGDDEGVIIAGIGIAVGILIAYLSHFFIAVSISQKVVVTDTLLSMKDSNSTERPGPKVENELPEL